MKLHRTFVPGHRAADRADRADRNGPDASAEGVVRSFRHPPGRDWVGAVFMTLPLAGALWAVPQLAAGAPLWLLVITAPFALLFVLLFGVIALALWGAALSAQKPTNWLVKFTDHGVFLNLRTYRNAHFAPAEGTVAAIPFGEIASARLVTESSRQTWGDQERTTRTRYVQLELRTSAAPLMDAVASERAREVPRTKVMGSHSSTKHHHYPVQAVDERTVRIEALAGLLEAFGEQVRLEPPLEVDLNRTLEGLGPEERALAFLRRGHRFEALSIARRELGMSKREAKAWVVTREANEAA